MIIAGINRGKEATGTEHPFSVSQFSSVSGTGL